MNSLTWNCRGLGRPRAVRALKEVLSSYRPQIVGLIETKVRNKVWDYLKLQLGFKNCFPVERKGLSGGLVLLWMDSIDLHIKSYSDKHIDAVIEGDNQFRYTLFYGEPEVGQRMKSWNLMRTLYYSYSKPWIIAGDFNEVLHSNEVQSKRIRCQRQIRNFREAVAECGLFDLNFIGAPFTYSNRRQGNEEVKSRLDRCLANSQWNQLFPEAQVLHATTYVSDHCPIVLCFHKQKNKRMNRTFRFEPMWFRHPTFKEVVKESWNSMGDISLRSKLSRLSQDISSWNRNTFGNVQRSIKMLKADLEEIREKERNTANVEKEKKIIFELDEWLVREEILWRQRSRIEWLKEGDSNTSYFHSKASCRKQMNAITSLCNIHGDLETDTKKMKNIVTEYFSNIFSSGGMNCCFNWDEELKCVRPKVTAEMNMDLIADVSTEEIKKAVFDLPSTKAPGIDGYSAVFFQKSWDIVKMDIIKIVQDFFTGGILDRQLNRTMIVLIPKVKGAKKVEEFRPISLCNVVMKVISKILANRLRTVLDSVISISQSAFVGGRLITDNFIIAHELSHFIKGQKRNKSGFASIKLDMSKAYDRVEWYFLEKMLLKLGFDQKIVNWVMLSVRTVSYQVKINSDLSRVILPSRGLRQGDPISPYLFIICTEYLTARLDEGRLLGRINGINISRHGPSFSHLFFADDSIFFIKANGNEAAVMKEILNSYASISGQLINLQKSEIVFSPNVNDMLRNEISTIFGVKMVISHGKYLGLPLVVGQKKSDIFTALLNKFWKYCNDWKQRNLSLAGKEVLIKAILQAFPQYMMSVYAFPKKTIAEMDKAVMNFWWSCNKKKSIHWLNKNYLTWDKPEGGLGFKDFYCFNDAFLLKQCWRIVKYPELPMSRLVLSKYCMRNSFLTARLGNRPSQFWRSLFKVKHLLNIGTVWSTDNNSCSWKFTSSGEFSVKSAYIMIKSMYGRDKGSMGESSNRSQWQIFWKDIWRLHIPGKIKLFIWKIYHDILPVARNLIHKRMDVENICKLCGYGNETVLHILKDCWIAKALGYRLKLPTNIYEATMNCPADWLWWLASNFDAEIFRKVMIAAWFCWINRNNYLFEDKSWDMSRLENMCNSMLSLLNTSNDNLSEDGIIAIKWRPPAAGTLKVNCDASVDSGLRCAGIGAIVRDCNGTIWGMSSDFYMSVSCVNEAEGKALLLGMHLCMAIGAKQAILEIDSSDIFKAIVYDNDYYGRRCSWISECYYLLHQNLGWSLKLVTRKANAMADGIAKKARMDLWRWNSIEAIPVILSSFFDDCIHK